MTNKFIEVVKRWRAGEAISVEALQANAADAWAAAYVTAAYAKAADATYAAEAASTDYGVKRHDKLLEE